MGAAALDLSAVMIGSALGARVVAVDVAEPALDRARELGAEQVINASRDPDTAASIREITQGGARVSIDALGTAATAVASVNCLRRRGRHVQVGLLLGSASAPPLPMDRVIAQELEIYGSRGMAAHEYAPMLALVADGTLRPELLVGEILPLEEAGAAGRNGPAGDRSRDDCNQASRGELLAKTLLERRPNAGSMAAA